MDITLRKKKDAAQLVISGAENTRFFWDTFRLYAQEECTPCFYLDLDGDGCLTLELRFRYGEREVHSSAASEEWGQVYKLIAKDTIEEQILDLQDKKAALMDALSGTTEAGILEMSKEELLELLKIG